MPQKLLIRGIRCAAVVCLLAMSAASVAAQADKLVGRWEGTLKSPQGERPTSATFTKEGETYAGKMPGIRPGTEMILKEIKVDGSKVTAKADVEGPQGAITINYTFTLEGDALNGQGAIDFSGQSFNFDISLKRAAEGAAGAPAQAAGSGTGQAAGAGRGTGQGAGQGAGQGGGRQRNPDVAQPQQKQSIDYFVGQWSYNYIGRESGLGQAPRDCTVTYVKRADGRSVDGATQCKFDGGSSSETSVIVFDEASKMLTVSEKLSAGATLNSRGDWTSPISIRFTVDPVKIKGQTLQLRRTISVVSAHSFTIADELSEDGGPFVRLGRAVVSKVGVQ